MRVGEDRRLACSRGAIAVAAALVAAACESFASSGNDAPAVVDAGALDAGDGSPIVEGCDAPPSTPDPFVTTETGASFVVLDADHVYWASAQRIQRQRLDRSSAPQDVATPTIEIVQLAVTEDHVVWRNGEGTIHAVPKSGGPSVGGMGSGQARDVTTASGGKVLWVQAGDGRLAVLPSPTPSFVSSRGNLQRIAASGVTAVSLNLGGDAGAVPAIWSIGTDINITDVLVLQDPTWAPTNLATDGERVFFTDVVAKRVGVARVVAASSGNPAITLATAQEGLGPIAENGDEVFWAASGTIRSVKKSGGCVRTLATGVSREFAVSGQDVYVVKDGATIARVPR